METQPDFERFLRAMLKSEEPERVPIAEFGMDWGVIEVIQGPPPGEGGDAVAAWLARGSEEDVRAYTRRCISESLPGGGWALGPGNTIANYVPTASFMAMVDEARRWAVG